MRHLFYTIITIGVVTFCSCDFDWVIIPTEETEVLEYDNILIYSDLSSRMQKSPNDSIVIEMLIDYFCK